MRHDYRAVDQRFIPACAGNSRTDRRTARYATGSSPRVRGTLLSGQRRPQAIRFIPACAGNSIPTTFPLFTVSVHPRVCGELGPANLNLFAGVGSSPRVRGTRGRRCRAPAPPPPVHPRVCGELSPPAFNWLRIFGSSPRVRGTPAALPARRHRLRFIPACAGNSARGPERTAFVLVHPRVCGELERLNALEFDG